MIQDLLKKIIMKRLLNFLLILGLTTGIVNCADAQRGRNNNESSRRGGRESSGSGQRGGERSFSADRGNFGNRNNAPANVQRGGREITANRESVIRNIQPRNEFNRFNVRDNSVARVNTVQTQRFDRGRDNVRVSNNFGVNRNNGFNRFNNNYRPGYYHGGYGRGFSFAYGPRFSIIPRARISLFFGGNPYYYYNGFYYGYYGGYYEPIFPPIGLRIGFLPYGYSSLFIGGFPYYYYNGTYYRQYDDNDYEVVDPPMGATVVSLPKGAKSVVLNGEKMYELNGTYYKEGTNSKGEVIYSVVGKNGEINNTDSTDDSYNNLPPANNDVTNPSVSLQMGDIVSQLPQDSRVATINGEKLYVTPDETYLKEEADNGVVQYKVVGVAK
jgi:Family of unknown function (DUF6515)